MLSTTQHVRRLSMFEDQTKRIDLFRLEEHLARSRPTAVMTAVVCPAEDDTDDTRVTTPRNAIVLAPEPPPVVYLPRPPAVYPVRRRDPTPLVILFILLSALAATISVLLY